MHVQYQTMTNVEHALSTLCHKPPSPSPAQSGGVLATHSFSHLRWCWARIKPCPHSTSQEWLSLLIKLTAPMKHPGSLLILDLTIFKHAIPLYLYVILRVFMYFLCTFLYTDVHWFPSRTQPKGSNHQPTQVDDSRPEMRIPKAPPLHREQQSILPGGQPHRPGDGATNLTVLIKKRVHICT